MWRRLNASRESAKTERLTLLFANTSLDQSAMAALSRQTDGRCE
jgi:hypothetical protein